MASYAPGCNLRRPGFVAPKSWIQDFLLTIQGQKLPALEGFIQAFKILRTGLDRGMRPLVIAILFIQTTKEYFSHRKRSRNLNYFENEGTNFAFRYNTLDRWGYLDCSELNLQLFSQTIQFTLFLVNHPTGSKRLMSSARIASRSGRKVSACFELVNKMKRLEQKSTLNVGPSSFFARFEIGPICFKKLPSCQLTKNNCMASTL